MYFDFAIFTFTLKKDLKKIYMYIRYDRRVKACFCHMNLRIAIQIFHLFYEIANHKV